MAGARYFGSMLSFLYYLRLNLKKINKNSMNQTRFISSVLYWEAICEEVERKELKLRTNCAWSNLVPITIKGGMLFDWSLISVELTLIFYKILNIFIEI